MGKKKLQDERRVGLLRSFSAKGGTELDANQVTEGFRQAPIPPKVLIGPHIDGLTYQTADHEELYVRIIETYNFSAHCARVWT